MHVMGNGVICRYKDGHTGKCSILHPSVYEEIRTERKAQDAEWGGAVHDDKHSHFDWWGFIKQHNDRSIRGQKRDDYRKQLIRVAALAVAAIQSFDRKTGRPNQAGEERKT